MGKIRTNDIGRMLFAYWIILVIWQNIRPNATGSTMDTVIKILLLFGLVFFFLRYSNGRLAISAVTYVFLLMICCFCITFIIDKDMSLRTLVSYAFPIVLVFIVYCVGSNFCISLANYDRYLMYMIAATLYMAFYSFVFRYDYFLNIMHINNAYTRQLSSFFVSNHEYAMYLTFAMSICMLKLLQCKKNLRIFYILCIVIFAINLVLTYSRTALLACLLLSFMFVMLSKNIKLIITYFSVIAIVGFLILQNSTTQNYLNNIVLREDNSSGRPELLQYGISIFYSQNIIKQIFGVGYGTAAKLINSVGHSSLHNGFLEVLITNGIVGILFLTICIISSVRNALKLIRINKTLGAYFFALCIAAIAFMTTNTSIIYTSPLPSTTLTFFCFVIPKYVANELKKESNRINESNKA